MLPLLQPPPGCCQPHCCHCCCHLEGLLPHHQLHARSTQAHSLPWKQQQQELVQQQRRLRCAAAAPCCGDGARFSATGTFAAAGPGESSAEGQIHPLTPPRMRHPHPTTGHPGCWQAGPAPALLLLLLAVAPQRTSAAAALLRPLSQTRCCCCCFWCRCPALLRLLAPQGLAGHLGGAVLAVVVGLF